jgi:hypothetical protein
VTEVLNIEQLRLRSQNLPPARSESAKDVPDAKGAPRHARGERFLLGPIPWDWLVAAGSLSNGKAMQVGIYLWHLSGMRNKAATVSLNLGRVAKEFHADRSTFSRGLQSLEEAGLVKVLRRPGAKSLVTILAAPRKGHAD